MSRGNYFRVYFYDVNKLLGLILLLIFVKMKCFLVVNQLNDPFYIDYDVEFAEYIIRRAKDKGLLEPHAVNTELDANLVMQLFSPLVLSQWLLIDQTKEPCSCICCPNGFRFVFRHVDELLFIAINGDNTESEVFLHRKIQVFITVMRFMFGPVSEEMGQSHAHSSKRAKWDFLRQLMRNWSELVESEQAYLVEAIERLHVNQMVNEKCVEVLEKSVKQFQATSDQPIQHALLLVNSKMLALFSKATAHELRSKDILALMILAKTIHPQADKLEDLFSRQYEGKRHSRSVSVVVDDFSDGADDVYHSAPNTPGGHRSRSPSTIDDLSSESHQEPTIAGSLQSGGLSFDDTITVSNTLKHARTYDQSMLDVDTVKNATSSDLDSSGQITSSSEGKTTLLDMYKEKYEKFVSQAEQVEKNAHKSSSVETVASGGEKRTGKEVPTTHTVSVDVIVHHNEDSNRDDVLKTVQAADYPPLDVSHSGDDKIKTDQSISGAVYDEHVEPQTETSDVKMLDTASESKPENENLISTGEETVHETPLSVTSELPSTTWDEPVTTEQNDKMENLHENTDSPERTEVSKTATSDRNMSSETNTSAVKDKAGSSSDNVGTAKTSHYNSVSSEQRPADDGTKAILTPLIEEFEHEGILLHRESPHGSESLSRPSSAGVSSKQSRSSTASSEVSNGQQSSVTSSIVSNVSKTYPELSAQNGQDFQFTGSLSAQGKERSHEPVAGVRGPTMKIESPRMESMMQTMPSPSVTDSSVMTMENTSSLTTISSSISNGTYLPQTVFLESSTCLYSPYHIHTVQISPGVTIILLSQAPRQALADLLYQVIHTIQDLIYGRRSKLPRSRSTYVYDIINAQLAKLQSNLKKFKGKVRGLSHEIHTRWEKEDLKHKLLDFLEKESSAQIPPELESPMLELYKKLRELFSLLYLSPVTITADLLEALSHLRERISTELFDYREYLNVKAQRNITMTTYIEEFPGLVHFVFIDRHFNQMTAPSLNISLKAGESMDATSYLKEKIWYMYQHMMTKLTEGYTTIMMRDGDFYFSYFLWFEDYKGTTLSVQESFKPSRKLPYPGILCGSFYKDLLHQCFPHAIQGAVHCFEMFLMHLGTVHPQYIASHCRKLAHKMWEMSGEAYNSVGLL